MEAKSVAARILALVNLVPQKCYLAQHERPFPERARATAFVSAFRSPFMTSPLSSEVPSRPVGRGCMTVSHLCYVANARCTAATARSTSASLVSQLHTEMRMQRLPRHVVPPKKASPPLRTLAIT